MGAFGRSSVDPDWCVFDWELVLTFDLPGRALTVKGFLQRMLRKKPKLAMNCKQDTLRMVMIRQTK